MCVYIYIYIYIIHIGVYIYIYIYTRMYTYMHNALYCPIATIIIIIKPYHAVV